MKKIFSKKNVLIIIGVFVFIFIYLVTGFKTNISEVEKEEIKNSLFSMKKMYDKGQKAFLCPDSSKNINFNEPWVKKDLERMLTIDNISRIDRVEYIYSYNWIFFKTKSALLFVGGHFVYLKDDGNQWCIDRFFYK